MESEISKSDVRVIGIDPSLSGTAVAIMDGRGSLVNMKRFCEPSRGTKVRERMERFQRLAFCVEAMIATEKPSIICIEGYSFRSNGRVSDLCEYGGLLRAMICGATDAEIYEPVPSSLKKWSCGKGNAAGKTPVVMALFKRYGVEFETDDEYDAYALARMALQIGGHEEPATTAQSEAIDTVIHGSVTKRKKEAAKAAKKKTPSPKTMSQLF